MSSENHTYASPLISPYYTQSQKRSIEYADGRVARDTQLFVTAEAAVPIALDEPPYPQETKEVAVQDVITKHMQSPNYTGLETRPSRADYELVASIIFGNASKYPRWWSFQATSTVQKPAEVQAQQRFSRPELPSPSSSDPPYITTWLELAHSVKREYNSDTDPSPFASGYAAIRGEMLLNTDSSTQVRLAYCQL